MIRLLHAADLHLDSPFEGLSDEKAALRRAEQRDLLRRLVELRADSKSQLVLLSGDIFDSHAAFAETEEALCSALAQMEVPVFIAPGNHDYYSRGSSFFRLQMPDNVRVFTTGQMTAWEIPELNARVWGAAFTDKYENGLLRGFTANRREGFTELLCLHGELAASSQYNPILEAELAASGIDYVALGHIHSFSGLRRAGDCFYAWPGCPEGRGFDECGEKGVIIADVEPKNVQLQFVPICSRKYETLEVRVGDDGSVELPELDARNTYKIILTGETFKAPDLALLRAELEEKTFSYRLRDETKRSSDAWENAGEDSLRGVFLSLLREKLDSAADDAERERIKSAARWGLAALEGREEVEQL